MKPPNCCGGSIRWIRFSGLFISPDPRTLSVHRPTIAIVTIVLLAGAAGGYFFDSGTHGIASACWRVGMVTAMLWLALPELNRVRNKWLFGLMALGLVLAAVRPKLLPLLLVITAAYAVLRPRRVK